MEIEIAKKRIEIETSKDGGLEKLWKRDKTRLEGEKKRIKRTKTEIVEIWLDS